MLRVTDAQLDQIAVFRMVQFRQQLATEVAAFMAHARPDVSMDEVALRYDAAMQRAGARGMDTEQALTRYAHILVTVPRGFEHDARYGWIAAILDGGGTADERLDQISAALMVAAGG
jgi:hypothetical protein